MEIIDNSGDKMYFTQVPNFILNHSSAVDQALYLQMKRITGEREKCKAGEKYFCKQLGIGRKALKKSLQYLIDHKWIEKVGKEPVMTAGGKQEINCYIVNDIWKMNMQYYNKGVSEREHLEDKGVSESNCKGCSKGIKGVLKRDKEEELIQEEQSKKNNSAVAIAPADNINPLIKLFEAVNPSYERLYPNKGQRSALARLVKKYGEEKVGSMIRALPDIVNQQYAPKITTPYELEKNLGKLILFVNQNKKGIMQL